MSTFAFRTFTPIGDRVLVQVEPRIEKSKGGIWIPEVSQEVARTGHVRAIGKGVRDATGILILEQGAAERFPELKAGDRVHFGPRAGTRFQHDGASWLILNAADLLGVEEAA
jgi:chaperonin GroES